MPDAADPDLLIDFKEVSLRRDGHVLVGPVSWSVELDERRVVAFLQLRFTDGALWTLQIGLINRPAARQLLSQLRPA